jgi:transcriptional regulator with XRE-family HTH domain
MPDRSFLPLKKVGDYLQRIRKSKSMTQKDVARKLGISHQMVSQQENIGKDFSLTTTNDLLVVVGGTKIDWPEMKVPIVKATEEDRHETSRRNQNRIEGEKVSSDFPGMPRRDLL